MSSLNLRFKSDFSDFPMKLELPSAPAWCRAKQKGVAVGASGASPVGRVTDLRYAYSVERQDCAVQSGVWLSRSK